MQLHDHHLPPATCPYCEKLLDGASGIDHTHLPKPNDFTVCIYCAQILRFAHDMSLRKVSPGELSIQEPRLRANIEFTARTIRRLKRRG